MLRWLPFVLMLISSGARAQGLVINEVLARPSQVQADCEWVELFNSGSAGVNLRGWRFEGKPISEISFSLQGEGYFIVARELVDNDSNGISFESVWGDSSGIWGDNSLLENYAAIQLSMVLNDGRDSVSLVSPLGEREVFHWETTTEGKSWEKVEEIGEDVTQCTGVKLCPNACSQLKTIQGVKAWDGVSASFGCKPVIVVVV